MSENGRPPIPFYPPSSNSGPSPWLGVALTALGLAATAISGYTSLAVGRVEDKVIMLDARLGRVEQVLMNGSGRR